MAGKPGSGTSAFEAAAERVVDAAGAGTEPDARDAELLEDGVCHFLRASFPRLAGDVRALAAETVADFRAAAAGGLVDPGHARAPHLLVIARNLGSWQSTGAPPPADARDSGALPEPEAHGEHTAARALGAREALARLPGSLRRCLAMLDGAPAGVAELTLATLPVDSALRPMQELGLVVLRRTRVPSPSRLRGLRDRLGARRPRGELELELTASGREAIDLSRRSTGPAPRVRR